MTDFQAQSSKQGREFEEAVIFMLKAAEWTIDDVKTKIEGIEIDIIATGPDGEQWWIECKGSHRGKTPGSKRGATAKKAVGVAAVLATLPNRRPYMLITSHLPKEGTVAHTMLRVAQEQGWFANVTVLSLFAPTVDVPDDDIGEDE
jgi:Holliday junction resolvase-like predicted endonuclease